MDAYFDLPRNTRAAPWFERILPGLPLRLPPVTLSHWTAYHVHGPDGGSWSSRLDAGNLLVQRGVAGPLALQISMTSAHFREAIVGALRERLAIVLGRLGKPVALPDLSRVPADPARLVAAAAVGGSIAFVLHDRAMDDDYRYVLTLGAGAPDLNRADATIHTDLDDLVALLGAKTPPLKLLTSGKLRVTGDLDLPMRALSAALGA